MNDIELHPEVELEGQRIELTKPIVHMDYAKEVYATVDECRKHLLPWLNWARKENTSSPEDSLKYLEWTNERWIKEKEFTYAITHVVSGELLGFIGVGVRGVKRNRAFEIGYWLKERACGYGYMQEAIKLVETEFFGLGAQRLFICCQTANLKSAKVAENAGYRFEGIRRQGEYLEEWDDFGDVKIYSKLKGEYNYPY